MQYLKSPLPAKYIKDDFNNRMKFVAHGMKASPNYDFIPFKDLLWLPTKTIRKRQRKITTLLIGSWAGVNYQNPKKSILTLPKCLAN